jgi:glycosyltransferase involved in cell wall biosynthesis
MAALAIEYDRWQAGFAYARGGTVATTPQSRSTTASKIFQRTHVCVVPKPNSVDVSPAASQRPFKHFGSPVELAVTNYTAVRRSCAHTGGGTATSGQKGAAARPQGGVRLAGRAGGTIREVRFVFLNPVGEFGGAERSLVAWMGAVRQAYPAADLSLIVPAEGLLAERAGQHGVEVRVLPLPPVLSGLGDSALRRDSGHESRLGRFSGFAGRALLSLPAAVRYARQLRAVLADMRPTLIHSNGIKCHLALWLARRLPPGAPFASAPVVWHIHDFIGRRPLAARALRLASSGLRTAVAVSSAVAADATAILPGAQIRVVHNVVDPDRFSPAPGDESLLDKLAGLAPAPPGAVRVVLVATFARWKGQDVFLEAAGLVRQLLAAGAHGSPPVRFYIVGGPIYRTPGSQFSREELTARAERLGVAADVGFIGFQDDPAAVYRAADVAAHASVQPEPFGLTIVESMACGRATVVSRAGGAEELFTDGEDALGVPPGDPAALANAILTLARDPALRARLGASARSAVVGRFNPADLPRRVAEIYQPLLAPGPR